VVILVCVSVPGLDAADAFGKIRLQVSVPLISDIHFDYKIALRVAKLGVDCLRINPGNIGREDRIRAVVDAARDNNIPIRIGVNAGSLEKDLQKKYGEPTHEALVESAFRHIDILDRLDFQEYKISLDRKSTRLNSSHGYISYAVFCLKKKTLFFFFFFFFLFFLFFFFFSFFFFSFFLFFFFFYFLFFLPFFLSSLPALLCYLPSLHYALSIWNP